MQASQTTPAEQPTNAKLDFNATIRFSYGLKITNKTSTVEFGTPDAFSIVKSVRNLQISFDSHKNNFEDFKKKHSLPDNTPILITVNGNLGNENFNYVFTKLDSCQKLLLNIAAKASGKVPASFNLLEGVDFNPNADKQSAMTTIDIQHNDAVNLAHAKLLKLTTHYLKKKDLDPAKKAIFETLKATLEAPAGSTLEKIAKFTEAFNKADKSIIGKYRTADWKRYAYNVLSILTVFPALLRMACSYAQYGSMRFWKATSVQAFDGMSDTLKTVQSLKKQ